MKVKLLKKLRKRAKKAYRLHSDDGKTFDIQRWDEQYETWLYGDYYSKYLDDAISYLHESRRLWILNTLHRSYKNKRLDTLNKKLQNL